MKIVFEVNGKKVPLKSLKYISKENQLEVMRNWFFANFEDPANSCPYDGKEGGYAYIYGGRMMRAKSYKPCSINTLSLSISRN